MCTSTYRFSDFSYCVTYPRIDHYTKCGAELVIPFVNIDMEENYKDKLEMVKPFRTICIIILYNSILGIHAVAENLPSPEIAIATCLALK